MKNIEIRDLMEIQFPSNPLMSPDGSHTAYVVSKQNERENRYESWLWLLDNATGASRQLTFSGKEADFVWEDGRTLLFATERGEADKPEKFQKKTCFYRLPVDGGEARKAFEVPLNVAAIRPLGDGKYLVNAVVDLNEPPEDMDETLRGDEKDYHVLEELPFWSNGRGYISRLRSALFVFDSGDGSLEKLTGEFFNVRGFDCDGGRVLYYGCDYQEKSSLFGEVKLCDLATGETVDLVEPGKYSVDLGLLAGESAVLALSTLDEWGLGQLHDLYRCDLASKALTLAQKMDFSIGPNVLFDCSYGGGQIAKAVGEDVYFIGQRADRAEIYRLTAQNALEKAVAFEGCIRAFDADGDRIAFVGHEANRLGEVYVCAGGARTCATAINDAFLKEHYVAEAKYIPFTDSDGVQIDGWLLEPQDVDPGRKYPGVLEIHGGPRCAYGTAFYHEMQALAGAGYYVFFCNPRGSDGYGEAFADLRGRYGTIDYQDLMEFTDHVLALVPQIDPARIAATGGSYGGFMCNWIEGHTDRFAAIASQRSISNWVADFGASEIGFTFDANETGGTPWTDMEKMWEQSPLKYACNAKTPILFIHSLEDYNCTLDQGVEMFSAMKYFGVPSRMCLFEGENHSLSRSGKPRHRVRRLTEIMNWFDKYLK